MKRVIYSLATISIAVFVSAVSGAEVTTVPNSTSPDGAYHLQVVAPIEKGDSSTLSLVATRSGTSISSAILGSYAAYPLDADPMNLGLLWSPDSHRFALMVRGTKRSWTTSIYSVSERELKSIDLPSATTNALAILGTSGVFRVCRETPLKWSNADHLVVRASGDAEVDKHVIWYEVDVTYALAGKKISDAKLISTIPHES